MRKFGQRQTHPAEAWLSDPARSPAEGTADISDGSAAQVLLWQMGLVVAGALGFAFAVNIALAALHIG
ncbi:MAG: hypothetical protein JO208_07045 [Alphaproteobacteria bacterium]|nr:hypothetical protein [Alphaproteobacteria bacterium]